MTDHSREPHPSLDEALAGVTKSRTQMEVSSLYGRMLAVERAHATLDATQDRLRRMETDLDEVRRDIKGLLGNQR